MDDSASHHRRLPMGARKQRTKPIRYSKLLWLLVALLFVCFASILRVFQVVTVADEKHGSHLSNVLATFVQGDDGDQFCLTMACLDMTAASIARAFPTKPKDSWCPVLVDKTPNTTDNENDNNARGLLMVKVPKAASSTTAGVALRIQDRNRQGDRVCPIKYNHGFALAYANRSRNDSFLWTSIRDPAKRALSRFFFIDVSKKGFNITDKSTIVGLGRTHPKFGTVSEGQGGFQTQYTSLVEIEKWSAWNESRPTDVVSPKNVIRTIKAIVDGYDFLVMVERMDESLVALAMILGVPLEDVLISSGSKVAGKNYFFRFRNCFKLVKPYATPTVQKFLDSTEWRAKNYGDYLLHKATNHSLDLTIESLGRERFAAKLQEYRDLKELERKLCPNAAMYPCSDRGRPQMRLARKSCYAEDFGCGYPCVDKMLRDRANNKLS